ncbi:MAG: glutamine synthetase family protein [Eubacteriaceae bacterium]|jgi:glutamine synthetase
MNPEEVLRALDYIEENDVRFIRLQFCDLDGQNRNIAVSQPEFETALRDGCQFRSSAVTGFESAGTPDLTLVPIPSTIQLLPWRPQQGSVAKVNCEIRYPDGTIFDADSRVILKRITEYARKRGVTFETGVKIEFYLFELDDEGKPTKTPVDQAGFFDLAPLDKGENTRREIILTLEDMGFSIKSSHHETGSGQHEIDFNRADPLTCADNIQTFKTVVKTIAQQNGMHASFMPKPLNGEPGSGMHVMISMLENLQDAFHSADGLVSETGRAFSAGIMKYQQEIIAVTNPSVNSYKRLAGGFIAPHDLKWAPTTDDTVIRIPEDPFDLTRVIIRSPDPSCNPYLAFAVLLAAGLSGIQEELRPEDWESDRLPFTLYEAVRKMKDSELVRKVLGDTVFETFTTRKVNEWNDYRSTVHDWEYEHYFETV